MEGCRSKEAKVYNQNYTDKVYANLKRNIEQGINLESVHQEDSYPIRVQKENDTESQQSGILRRKAILFCHLCI